MTAAASPEPVLLAVDLGLTTGLALYGRDGRVRWYRSRHLANHSTLRRAARSLLGEPGLCSLWVEGGGALANVWTVEAARLGIPVTQVTAEAWRAELLLEPRPAYRPDGQGPRHSAGSPGHRMVRPTAPHGAASRHGRSDPCRAVGGLAHRVANGHSGWPAVMMRSRAVRPSHIG